MGGRGVSLVIAAALGACAPELPRGIHVEAAFTPEEAAIVSGAIASANDRLGAALVGHPVLDDLGAISDPDGFQYDDLGDGVGVVYALDPASPEYRWLADTNERDYQGYGTLGDVLIAIRLPAAPTDADRQHFRQVVLHELGHYLGLPHVDDREAIMYSGPGRLALDTYTTADQQTFCLVYGC